MGKINRIRRFLSGDSAPVEESTETEIHVPQVESEAGEENPNTRWLKVYEDTKHTKMDEFLTIVMTTYNRPETAIPTLKSLVTNLHYNKRRWIIADDGSPEDYITALRELIDTGESVEVTNAGRRGVGVSKNLALRLAFQSSPLVFLTEDDWLLEKPLDPTVYMATLMDHPNAGMVRCGYLAYDMGLKMEAYNGMTYLRLMPGSGVYVYSGQCSFRSYNFYKTIGFHAEGISAGEEELNMCYRYNAHPNPPQILWPGDQGLHFQSSYFKNIGFGNSQNAVQPES